MTQPAALMAGKRGLIMGVANDHSIAWGIAQMLASQGAEIAFTYQGDAQAKRLKPLAESVGSTIAIAWKETAEAARAVTAAMPILAKAKKIVVLTASESSADEDAEMHPAEYLTRQLAAHGFKAEAREVEPGKRSAADALIAAAHEAGADLLVMGAYSHSRFRELVFGVGLNITGQPKDFPGELRSIAGSLEHAATRRLDPNRQLHLRDRRPSRQARASLGWRQKPHGGHA